MKAGWEVKPLGELIEPLETLDPRKAPAEEFTYIDVSSVSRNKLEVTETTNVLGAKAPSRARRKVRENDVLFATIRPTLKRIAVIPANLNEAICSTGYMVLRASNQLDHRFLFYALQSENFADAMESLQRGASYPAVSDGDIKSQEIPIPPLEEQKQIVAVLDAAFEGLTRATAHAEANLQNARELFEADLRAVFDRCFIEYEIFQLDRTCDVRDGTHDSPKYVEHGIPFVTQKNVKDDGLTLTNTKRISEEDHLSISKRSQVGKGDILISMIGVNRGMACLVDTDELFSIKNVGLIRETEALNMQFLLFYLKSPQAAKYVETATNGGAQPFIGLKKLRAFPYPNVPKSEQYCLQKKLTRTLDQSKELISNYHTKLIDIEDLRQSLLQKAFAGELT